ncbi:TIGR04552 family protein [bacterium]|nr:TIGR04552 family protein [bacterium]
MEFKNKLEENFLKFPFELFDAIFSQKSFIDIERLNVHDRESGLTFIKNYGYDITDPKIAETVSAILSEAKTFIQTYLLEDPEGKSETLLIPPDILCNDDIVSLLIMASEKEKTLEQAWACAILRVAHTITHVENDLAKSFMPGIRNQIYKRFSAHLNGNSAGGYFLGTGDDAIRLKLFEIKNDKSRDSLILKLLHKKENVTADIFDRVGVRIVTYTKLDIILVLRYFATNHVISFANIKPSRTKNNVVNIPRFIEGVEELKSHDLSSWSQEDVSEFLERYLEIPPEEKAEITKRNIEETNLYSSTSYSSIQLTSRLLITVEDPINPAKPTYRFFFPFEVQILDEESFVESRSGRANHEEYKKNQTIAARRRVLTNVIRYMRQHPWEREILNEK